jgi:hypothetical protein
MLDLIEYARPPRRALLRELLETGTVSVSVLVIRGAPAEVRETSDVEEDTIEDVTVGTDPDQPSPSPVNVRAAYDGRLLATVPVEAHADVQAVLAAGVLYGAKLQRASLEFRLLLE